MYFVDSLSFMVIGNYALYSQEYTVEGGFPKTFVRNYRGGLGATLAISTYVLYSFEYTVREGLPKIYMQNYVGGLGIYIVYDIYIVSSLFKGNTQKR